MTLLGSIRVLLALEGLAADLLALRLQDDVHFEIVGRTEAGYAIRIEGRGTMRESPALQRVVRTVLDGEACAVTIDLAVCDYLDSTFLGCLVDLHRRSRQRHIV